MWGPQSKCIPGNIISLIMEPYSNFSSRVTHKGSLTEPIQVKSGVRQGCLLSPFIFLSIKSEVMRKITGNHRRGITWSLQDCLEDLEYADNVCPISQSNRDMEDKLLHVREEAEKGGMCINVQKTKELRVGIRN
jgi:hypothetical protein